MPWHVSRSAVGSEPAAHWLHTPLSPAHPGAHGWHAVMSSFGSVPPAHTHTCHSIPRNQQHTSCTLPRSHQAPCQDHTKRTPRSYRRSPPRTPGTPYGLHSARSLHRTVCTTARAGLANSTAHTRCPGQVRRFSVIACCARPVGASRERITLAASRPSRNRARAGRAAGTRAVAPSIAHRTCLARQPIRRRLRATSALAAHSALASPSRCTAGTQSCLRSAQCRRTQHTCRPIPRNQHHRPRMTPQSCQALCPAHTPHTHHPCRRIPPRTPGTPYGLRSAPALHCTDHTVHPYQRSLRRTQQGRPLRVRLEAIGAYLRTCRPSQPTGCRVHTTPGCPSWLLAWIAPLARSSRCRAAVMRVAHIRAVHTPCAVLFGSCAYGHATHCRPSSLTCASPISTHESQPSAPPSSGGDRPPSGS